MDTLGQYAEDLQSLAKQLGLTYYPVDFEVVPSKFMTEIAVYGLPIRMPHWSFGVRWIYQMVQHQMGHSKIYEVVFPGDPNRAYLVGSNRLHENTLVVAHVLGHADFSHNNLLFQRSHKVAGGHIVEQAAAHARQIEEAIVKHGPKRVEAVLDAALALEQHIDTQYPLNRDRYPTELVKKKGVNPLEDPFTSRFLNLPGETVAHDLPKTTTRAPIPPHPEHDLLWFIAQYAPDMEDWERDIFLAVREESFYFEPVFQCQIMNEGWASHWHARLLREAEFIPNGLHVDAMKCHSDVVRPYASDNQVALTINPYHLGFKMWDHIVEEHGQEEAFRIRREEDDFSFIRNHLTTELAEELGLFNFKALKTGEVSVTEFDINQLQENILAPKFNFGAPRIYVEEMRADGVLVLRHDHKTDGRGLDKTRARGVLNYVATVWSRPILLYTVDSSGKDECIGHGHGEK